MTGDGELQEGQNWEALQAAAHERLGRLWVVVDRNELQSDKPTEEILALGDLEAKLRAFGWDVGRPTGTTTPRCAESSRGSATVTTRRRHSSRRPSRARASRSWSTRSRSPRAAGRIAGTRARPKTSRSPARRRARGAPRRAMRRGSGSTPPTLEAAERRGARRAASRGARERVRDARASRVTDEYVVEAYGEALRRARRGRRPRRPRRRPRVGLPRPRLRARLSRPLPRVRDRRTGHGLDGGRHGAPRPAARRQLVRGVPRRHVRTSRSTTRRARDEGRLRAALRGADPRGAGKSHQSVRDISLLAALPNMAVVQPGTPRRRGRSCAGRSRRRTRTSRCGSRSGRRRGGSSFPAGVGCRPRHGAARGRDAVLLAYGPVMLHEALLAAERWRAGRGGRPVVAMPWLNRFDGDWLDAEVGGLRARLRPRGPRPGRRARRRRCAARSPGRAIAVFGVEGWPACGTPDEALRFHGLDGASLAARIAGRVGVPAR